VSRVPPRMETRERVLRAAVRTLATEGYAATTARSVARSGGFAPGVIYYHFEDLEDLLQAAAQYTSERRLDRYRAELATATTATELLTQLRRLHAEDMAEGHIAAIQELVAAASSSPRLAERVREQIEPWHEFAEQILRGLISQTPLADVIPVREAAAAAVALVLGMELLSHLNAEQMQPEASFRAAEQVAAFFDALNHLPA